MHKNDSELLKSLYYFSPQQFPEWVPLGALLMLEHSARIYRGIKEVNPQHNRLIELHTRQEMQYSWEKVSKVFADDIQWGGAWFSWALSNAILNENSPYRPATPTSAKKWKESFIKNLTQATQAANDVPGNYYGWQSLFIDRLAGSILEYNPHRMGETDRIKELMEILPKPAMLLKIMSDTIATAYDDHQSDLYGKHPRGGGSARTYFINTLTISLYQALGKPSRKITADATSVAFDCEITEREIIRTAKVPSSKQSLVHGIDTWLINLVLGRST